MAHQESFEEWDYSERAIDIVAKSRRDMLRDSGYALSKALSSLRTLVRRIDSLERSYMSIALEHLLMLENEERRGEEQARGKAKGSTQTR